MTIEYKKLPEELLMAIKRAQENLVDFEILTNKKYDPNWHHELVAHELEYVAEHGDKDYKILIVTVPPRHGKSQQCSIDFPAWYLGKYPDREIITASYSADLAQDFGGKTREKVDSDEFQMIFPEVKLREDERAKGKWRTGQGGSYTSVGIGGALSGRGANVLLIDDPIKNREEAESELYREKTWNWFTSTAFTRLQPHGVVVIIMTRWHLDDLAGRVLAHPELSKRTKVMHFPAIANEDDNRRRLGDPLWPSQYSLQALEEIKSTIGPYDFNALYMGSPIMTETQEFKPVWFRKTTEKEVSLMNCRRFLTIDTAMSKRAQADYTGFCDNSVNKENFWHLRAWHARLGPEELVANIFALHEQNKYERIGIEKTAYSEGLKPFLDSEQRKRGRFLPLVELEHKRTSKEIRIRGLIPRYASGSVFHIDGMCFTLEEEMMQFPFGKHDDTLDACFVGKTVVLCERGNIPIKDVVVGDRVMTRQGYKKVMNAWCSGEKEVIKKIGLEGTPNHPIITDTGVVDLQYVGESSILHVWNPLERKIEKLSYTEAKNIIGIQTQKGGIYEYIFGGMINGTSHLFLSIGRFGSIILGRYLKNITYTIKMRIRLITQSIISSVFQLVRMCTVTANLLIGSISLEKWPRSAGDMQKYGISQKRVEDGIKNIQSKLLTEKKKNLFVLNAKNHIRQRLKELRSIVQTNVKIEPTQDPLDKKIRNITQLQAKKREKVYNLEVEDAHEYFANGILVHNCAYMLQIAEKKKAGSRVLIPKWSGYNKLGSV